MQNNPNRPLVWTPNRSRETSTLHFGEGVTKEFYVRGGISWPTYSARDNRVRGYAILGGQSCENGKVYVFEELEFFDIDTSIFHKQIIHGLAHMIALAWGSYGCRHWHIHIASDEKWIRRCRQSTSVEPRPTFREVTIENTAYRDYLLRYIQGDNMIYRAGGGLHRAMEELRLRDLAFEDYPELVAAGLLLSGLEEYPWRGAARPLDFPLTRRNF